MKLANQVAIITGASEGIGKALAELFAREGVRVVLAARSEEKLQALANALGPDRVLVVPTDVADSAQLKQLVARTVERFGGLDILVNNAGVGLYARVEEMDWEHFRRMWEVNFFAAVRLTMEALPYLQQRRGVVVNISSVAGKMPLPFMAGYCATKFALTAFSHGLRMELAPAGVRVLVVCPGRVRTEFHKVAYRDGRSLPRIFERRDSSGIPAERVAQATLRAIQRGRREIVVPWHLRLLVAFQAVFPGLTERVLARLAQQSNQAQW
ncbi:MAG: SDR family oxidoreductase [Acidobacteria bacterium]|nr:SDR family oxidoreductase [Acidobacteriota bacterium]